MIRYYTFLILISFFFCSNILAQPFKEMDIEMVEELAEEYFNQNAYYNALEMYEKLYEDSKDKETALTIANLNFNLRDYKKAASYYGRVVRNDKKKEYSDYYYELGVSQKLVGNYDEAKDAFLELKDRTENEDLIQAANLELKGMAMAGKLPELPEYIEINNAGTAVNSKYADFGAVKDPSSNTILYSSMNSDELVSDAFGNNYYAKIYSITRDENKKWGKPNKLSAKINEANKHSGGIAFSPDGKQIYYCKAITDGDKIGSSSLYVSNRVGNDDWSGAKAVEKLNDYNIQHPNFGELFGKPVLFFSSDRPGGMGGKDIFYAEFNDGNFSSPQPLSKDLNTKGDEVTPFFIENTLYFSSNGHPSMGGLDIFRSEWNGANWSKPENMGKGFNSTVDDFFYNKEGNIGFLVSNREGTRSVKSATCCDDIWVIDESKIELGLKLTSFNAKTKKPLSQVYFDMYEKLDNTVVDEINKESGTTNRVSFDVGLDKFYEIIASKDGYISDTLTLKTFDMTKSQIFEGSVYLIPIPKPKPEPKPEPEPEYEVFSTDQPIRLNNIYYDYDDDKILKDAENDLSILQDLLTQYSDMVIELSSHTDSRGNSAYNKKLAQRRAESARNWLLNKGIDGNRIKAVGYGEDVILNRCTNGVDCTDDEHRFNRRTEFKIISGPTSIKIEKKRLRKQ